MLADKVDVIIIGGGIGVAPVAGFAETLTNVSYDFYASFKSGSYGLENVKAERLVLYFFVFRKRYRISIYLLFHYILMFFFPSSGFF